MGQRTMGVPGGNRGSWEFGNPSSSQHPRTLGSPHIHRESRGTEGPGGVGSPVLVCGEPQERGDFPGSGYSHQQQHEHHDAERQPQP